tara:strand:- start:1284 stop:2558 length:1275 start_codon:yes stop_codon:yes gene_type:complete
MAKKRQPKFFKTKTVEPKWEPGEELTGEQYSRRMHAAQEHYRLDFKTDAYKKWIIEYCKRSDKWKDHVKTISKCPDREFRSSLGGLCRLSNVGCPDYYKPYAEYWESLAGTMGQVKPHSETINKWVQELVDIGSTIKKSEEKKKEDEKKKGTVYKPSIQERIKEQANLQSEPIEEWLEKWTKDPKKFKKDEFKFSKHFISAKVTQAHARVLLSWYEPVATELHEVLNPPTKAEYARMTEKEKDWADQLIEAYQIHDKKDVQNLYDGYANLIGALNMLIDMAKASRKTRKRAPKSKDKLVQKLKFKVSDDKYKIASINPIDIIGCNELWVFNVKTRKIGKYVASQIDPLRQEREGSGLSVKGTTITGFKESQSIQKTIRKPEEKLKEFHSAGKIKLRSYLEDINAVEIKLNGRINSETILLRAVR